MQVVAPLQNKANEASVKVTQSKVAVTPKQGSQNPLQLLEQYEEPLRKNPLQLKKNPQNPLQLAGEERAQQNGYNPSQLKPHNPVTPGPKIENNTGLPDKLKTGIENISGFSMDDVRVHYNSDKPAQLQALAYAQGTNIHIAPGQEKHLAHEAWHVVQQKQGRVQPILQMKEDVAVNNDKNLEIEADIMGAEALVTDTAVELRVKENPAREKINNIAVRREYLNRPPLLFYKILQAVFIDSKMKEHEYPEAQQANKIIETLLTPHAKHLAWMEGLPAETKLTILSKGEPYLIELCNTLSSIKDFNPAGELVTINTSIDLHTSKILELYEAKQLKAVIAASEEANADPGKISREHELVKSEGLRLRFHHHLDNEINEFINTQIPPLLQGKVSGFFLSQQDKLRFFDIVNETKSDVQKRALIYAAEKATDIRLMANHYTYFMSHNKEGKIPDVQVDVDYAMATKGADANDFSKQKQDPAIDATAAIRNIRQAGKTLSFESIPAAFSHLEKHPLGEHMPGGGDMGAYLKWARITIEKGEATAKRNQFDAGWTVHFNYSGQTAIAKIEANGEAFISSYTPQTTTAQNPKEQYFYDPSVLKDISGKTLPLKQAVEALRVKIKDRCVKDGRFKGPGGLYNKIPYNNDEDGAEFKYIDISTKRDSSITLKKADAPDSFKEDSPDDFTIYLNKNILSEASERVGLFFTLIAGKIDNQPPPIKHPLKMVLGWMDDETDSVDKKYLFNEYMQTQLLPNDKQMHTTISDSLMQARNAIWDLNKILASKKRENDPEIIQLSKEIEILKTEINELNLKIQGLAKNKEPEKIKEKEEYITSSKGKKVLVGQKDEKRKKETGADEQSQLEGTQRNAKQLFRFITILRSKIISEDFSKTGMPGAKGRITPDLINHLITPVANSLSTFRSNGLSGGHSEEFLKLFLSISPEYHLVEIKRVKALGSTMRLYQQFMWRNENIPPPAIIDLTNRPSQNNALPALWLEAGVKKSTVEDFTGWLNQGSIALELWSEFDPYGPSSQRLGRGLYENAPGDKAVSKEGVEFGGRVEYSRELKSFIITQLVPHIDWLSGL